MVIIFKTKKIGIRQAMGESFSNLMPLDEEKTELKTYKKSHILDIPFENMIFNGNQVEQDKMHRFKVSDIKPLL